VIVIEIVSPVGSLKNCVGEVDFEMVISLWGLENHPLDHEETENGNVLYHN